MSLKAEDSSLGSPDGAAELFARAAAAERRSHVRLDAAIDDLLTPEDGRLDDRLRAAVEAMLARLVHGLEGELRRLAGRVLIAREEPELALAVSQGNRSVLARLIEAQLVRDGEFLGELIARARLDLLTAALPISAPAGEEPSLLARLANHGDAHVSGSAVEVLLADSRRAPGDPTPAELPAELHHKLVWWIAAALHEAHADDRPGVLDAALAEAAHASLAAHDEGRRPEAAAMRLAIALDAPPEELPALLTQALGDRRAVVFVALLARALGIDFDLVREIVLDPAGDRLWLALRALDLPRESIARIGLALSDADSRRDLEAFAEAIDTIAAIDPSRARTALAPLRLDAGFRAARQALARRPAR